MNIPTSYARDLCALSLDLDDTIHQFRMASASAASAVFSWISEQYGPSEENLRECYDHILKRSQAGHFAEQKSSTEYRRERFSSLLVSFSILPLHDVDICLHLYENGLEQHLTLNAGAKACLENAQQKGLKTLVITEGPEDAQEWTLKKLGINHLVDMLVTTGATGVPKDQGLFSLAATRIGLAARSILHTGDNPIRDVRAAQKDGFRAVLYASSPKEEDRDLVSIPSLEILAEWIDQHCCGFIPSKPKP